MNLTVKYSEGIGWRGWGQIPWGMKDGKARAKARAKALTQRALRERSFAKYGGEW